MKNRAALLLCCLLLTMFARAQSPLANFSANTTMGCSPLVVKFQDQSAGNITAWQWDFGNGATSTLQNPSTTYFNTGAFTITLTVTDASGATHTLTRTGYITIYDFPTVNFSVNDSSGCFPHRAQFTDLSTASANTTNNTWLWDFGNGTQSTQQNPLVTYTSAGDFNITLKVTNDKGCSRVVTKKQLVQVIQGVTTNFTQSQPNVCQAPAAITFNNTSTGPGTLNYLWDFGDGVTSTEQNPVHTYNTTGNYAVTLTTTSSSGCSDTLRKGDAVVLPIIDTKFSAPDSVCIKTPVRFQNTSTPAPVRTRWVFSDGTTSTEVNPSKTFVTPGVITVKLYNTYSNCTDSFVKTIKVLPRPAAQFSAPVTTRCQPALQVDFKDASTNAVQWFWNFGDGATSTEQNPSHTYTSYGDFDVKLLVTNASGCTDSIKKTRFVRITKPVITIPALPAEGCIPFTISPVANITTLDAVISYLWDFGDGTTSTSPNPTVTYAVQGAYTVKLTITTSTGCTETLTIGGAVRVGRKPVVEFDAIPPIACAFQTVMFTDKTSEADEWEWNFGDGEGSLEQNPTHVFQDTGTFNVQLTATNYGCKDKLYKEKFITIKPPISRFKIATDCEDRLRVTFTDQSIGATSWLWTFGDGTTSTEQNPVHKYPGYANYQVMLTVMNDTCTHSTIMNISTVKEKVDFAADKLVACKPSVTAFAASTANPSNIVAYTWDFGNGSTAGGTAATNNVTYSLSGTYSVSLITTDINGCKDTVTKPNYIRINGPTAGFSSTTNTGCKGLTTVFNDLSKNDGVNNIVSWKWYFGDGTVQTYTAGPFRHTYLQAGAYTVKLVVRDASGCSDSLTIPDFVVTTDPKAAFSTADTLTCPAAIVNFQNTSTAINYTSVWDFGNGNSSTQNVPTSSYTASGVYTVKLRIRDQYGCQDSLIKINYIKVDQPVASFTVSDSVSSCVPFEVNFTNNSKYYTSSYWNLGGGGTSTQQHPTVYYTIPDFYNTSLIVTSPGGCTDTAYHTISLYDTTGTRITYQPLNGCTPLNVDLNAFTPGPVKYTWDFGDGALIDSGSASLKHVYNSFGDFRPKVIMTDPSGCIYPVTGNDIISIIGAVVKFDLDKSLLCDSGMVSFIDSTTYNDSIVTYNWNFGDGNTSNLQNPLHQYKAPGNYSVSLNVQTQNGCSVNLQKTDAIKVVQSPLIGISGDSVICLYEPMQHIGDILRTDTSAIRWRWQFPNGNASTMQLPDIQKYTAAGNFNVTTIVTNSSGCADTVVKNIRVNPLPVITLPSTLSVQAGFPVTIPATYSPNTATYVWSPAIGLSCTTCPQPQAGPKFDTKYNISVVDSNGCKSSNDVQVIVFCKNANVFIPNTFSPNGDGSNDVFYVRGKGLDRVRSLRIFNRWGEVVFEKRDFAVNDPSTGWDGRYKGNRPQPDVYVYQVEVFCENSQLMRYEGNVALIQ